MICLYWHDVYFYVASIIIPVRFQHELSILIDGDLIRWCYTMPWFHRGNFNFGVRSTQQIAYAYYLNDTQDICPLNTMLLLTFIHLPRMFL